jgi:hypothetical protein
MRPLNGVYDIPMRVRAVTAVLVGPGLLTTAPIPVTARPTAPRNPDFTEVDAARLTGPASR